MIMTDNLGYTGFSRATLLDLIDHEEIAFQFGDGLLTFTNQSFDEVLEEIAEMKKFISNSKSAKIVRPSDLIDDNDSLGFNDFAKWSTDEDMLLLVDECLLLCLPNKGHFSIEKQVAG